MFLVSWIHSAILFFPDFRRVLVLIPGFTIIATSPTGDRQWSTWSA